MANHWTVYLYTFPNGKVYIGSTKLTLSQRQGHQFKRYQPCKKIWDAIQEFGYQNIKEEILFEGDVPVEVAAEKERYFIAKYKANDPEVGYNIGMGGEGLTDKRHYGKEYATRRDDMIRQVAYSNRGRKHTEESKAKMRAAHLGLKLGPMSAETKAKISKANSRENMSEETKRRRMMANRRPVIATNKLTGEQLTFDSALSTAEHFGVRTSAVSRWINGTRNPTNGFTFQYISPTTTE